ncbi:MAG: hypothetical protein QMD71_08605 [bacterium]|nr:hypothetical protein [bacterium]
MIEFFGVKKVDNNSVVKALAQEWFQTGQEADIVLGPYVNSGGPSLLHLICCKQSQYLCLE